MSKAIWKYPIPHMMGLFDINMPIGAKMLTVQIQDGRPCFWAIADQLAGFKDRRFWSFGTGHDLPDDIDAKQYVGTYQLADLGLVWHVFVDPEEA